MKYLKGLEKKIMGYYPEADFTNLERAYHFTKDRHKDQKRLSGEPYIIHPISVVNILADLKMDLKTIKAGLLHDTIEDTTATFEDVKNEFGNEVALLVDGVSKIGQISAKTRRSAQGENLRKLFFSMARDIRVILIKLADRLHNMRTVEYLPPEKIIKISRETIDIYAPIASRLGIQNFKVELEDLAMKYLYPEEYKWLSKTLAQKRRERENYVKKIIKVLDRSLKIKQIPAAISGRPKHFYSIFNKITKKGKQLDEIHDLIGVRIVTDNKDTCYKILGIIHDMWRPIPGRIKDFISSPKPNMYQSLHTVVLDEKALPVEFQIRTVEMDMTAELGIAAHWLYKEGRMSDDLTTTEKFSWIRQILEWQEDLNDPVDFVEALKIDLYDDSVFVLTPVGEIIELRKDATPIDFAFAIHTEIGERCARAKVNGKIVPLNSVLKNGDIVSIETSKQAHPTRDWLKYCVSVKARNKINKYLKDRQYDTMMKLGIEKIGTELKKRKIRISNRKLTKALSDEMKEHGYNKIDDYWVNIGFGKESPSRIVTRIFPKEEEKREPVKEKVTEQKTGGTSAIEMEKSGLLTRIASCCNPVPGDDITGYLTRGRGVSIHRRNCPNLYRIYDDARVITVNWAKSPKQTFSTKIIVRGADRKGLLADITSVLRSSGTSITSAEIRTTDDGMAYNTFVIEIENTRHLNKVIEKIKKVKNVVEVTRPETA